MPYVIKNGGKFLGATGIKEFTEHLNEAKFFGTRASARRYKDLGEKIYRVKVKPVSFERVR